MLAPDHASNFSQGLRACGAAGSPIVWEISSTLSYLVDHGDFDLLRELFGCFLTTGADQLNALRRAASIRDLEALTVQAHRLKGSSAEMGARAMATLCGQLECAASARAEYDYVSTANQLERSFEEVSETLLRFEKALPG